jgi:hypothetical protein
MFGFRKKFSYLCYNDDEWVAIQKYLFKKGFKWKGSWENAPNDIRYCDWKYPIIIQNFRSDDKFGKRYLIMSGGYIKKEDKRKLIKASNLLRKQKILKIEKNFL